MKALNLPKMKEQDKRPIITTKKIRGELSQGLFIPISQFAMGDLLHCSTMEDEDNWVRTSDVTKLLGVRKKKEPKDLLPVFKQRVGSGGLATSAIASGEKIHFEDVFPPNAGPPKTEELRVQSYMDLLDAMQGLPYYITLKVDGTSATYGFDSNRGGLLVCSRNYVLSAEVRDSTVYGLISKEYNMEEKLSQQPYQSLVIQGEIYGPKVQANPLGQGKLKLAVFNIYNKEMLAFLTFKELQQTCSDLGLPMVPIEEVGSSFNYTLDELLVKAKGFYPGAKNHREGLVVRSQNLMVHGTSRPISFKVLNNDYLLS